ncbi:MAG: S24/S26 family peptidase [Clostridia bacterium]|nr:S24/S26 family peptidase [Clostridia bacterium]
MNETVQRLIQQISATGCLSFVPGGNSMWPTLKHKKQAVLIEKLERPVKLYDVLLYHRNGTVVVLHRVVGFSGDGYIVCGDNTIERETVAPFQIIGVMVGFYRGERFVPATDERYVKKVEKHFADETKRRNKVKRFARVQALKRKIKRIFTK